MRKRVPNFAIAHPVRVLAILPANKRGSLLKQMTNYLFNCEWEEKRLRFFRETVNRP
jgi:hypothetical protein